MKMDGSYSSLTFIATQTDGIDIRETMAEVDKDGMIEETFTREKDLDAWIQQAQENTPSAGEHWQQMDELNAACDAIDDERLEWQGLEKKLRKGQVVFAPAPKRAPIQAKRRRTTRRQVSDVDSDDDESVKVPLTQEQISSKLIELVAALDAKEAEVTAAEKQYEAACDKIELLQQQKANIVIQRARTCVQKRNDYSKVSL